MRRDCRFHGERVVQMKEGIFHVVLASACALAPLAGEAGRGVAERRDLTATHRGKLETALLDENIDVDNCIEWVDGQSKPCPEARKLLVPKGRSSETIYGLGFGRSPKAGRRHLRLAFKGEIPVGAIYLNSGHVSVSVLRANAEYPGDISKDDDWQPLVCLQGESRPSRTASGRGYSFWYGPGEMKTRALRITATANETDPVDEGGNRQGGLGAVYILPEPLFNLGPYAVADATDNGRDAKNLVDGDVESWNRWGTESGSGASAILSWIEPVSVRYVGLGQPYATKIEILACTAGKNVHPRDAKESEWKVVATVDGLRTGYPFAMRTAWVDLGRSVTTRGLRVRPVGAPAVGGEWEHAEHGHVEHYIERGRLSGLGELIVLGDRKTLKATRESSVLDDSKIGIPIDFEMPFDGVATLVVEDEKGNRVRNLVSARSFKAGRNRVYWDCSDDLTRDVDAAEHGLYHVPERPVAPGTYVVKGLAHKPLSGRYEMSAYNPGRPPWCTPDHTGAWLANHEPPRAACVLPAGRVGKDELVALGANITEGPDGLITVGLDGVKTGGRRWIGGTWTAAAFLACDLGERRIAAHDYYVGGLGKNGDTYELRITAIKGRGEERLAAVPLGRDQGRAHGGMAARDGLVVASLNVRNELWWRNLHDGSEGRVPLRSPRGLAFAADGTLYALSGSSLVKVDLAGGKAAEVVSGLVEPASLTAGAGSLFVSEQGDSNQIKMFAMDGRLVKTLGTAGPCRSGRYDPSHMNNPAEMALDSQGRLWVAEHDYLPKRISVWDVRGGRLARAFYGPPKYGAGGRADPRDPTRFYYTEGGGTLEFRLDYATGSTEVTRVMFRPDSDKAALDACGYPLSGEFASMPGEVIYGPKGERLYSNAYNTDPVSGTGSAILCREENDRFVPAAYAVFDRSHERFRLWSDRNSDGRRSDDEVYEAHASSTGYIFQNDLSLTVCFYDERPDDKSAPPRALCIRPSGYGPKGNPFYDFGKAETIFTGATWGPSTGGNQVLVDRFGRALTTNGVKPGPTYSVAGGPMGRATWSIPNMWPGLHAGHSAPRDAVKGRLVAVTRMLGDFVYPKGTDESVVALNGNHGEIYFITGDGYFVDNFFEDIQVGRRWNFPTCEKGMELAGVAPGDEHFWPTLTQYSDGSIHIVANDDSCTLVRLRGLETLRRFPAGRAVVTPEVLASVARDRERLEAARRARLGTGRLTVRMPGKAPAVDGDIGEWPEEDFVVIDSRGVAAYFDSNSKPYDIRGALAATKTHLYAAWKAQGVRNLADNAGGNDTLLFKTGGGLDVMLDVRGGIRLLAAQVGGRTKAMLYEKSVPGAKASDRVAFTSPVGNVVFDRVRDVSEKVRLAKGRDGNYELEVPLDLIGLRPAPGQTLKGDIGVLRGSGGETIARLYWSNKATGIVADVPSEAELKPRNWGLLEVK